MDSTKTTSIPSAAQRAAQSVPGIPRDTDGPVFREPWEAQAFAMALALHTREGMFCDPVYGGNHDRVGWELIGFPGPRSLSDTRDGSYGHPDKFLTNYDWADLIPHLRGESGRPSNIKVDREAREP